MIMILYSSKSGRQVEFWLNHSGTVRINVESSELRPGHWPYILADTRESFAGIDCTDSLNRLDCRAGTISPASFKSSQGSPP